MKKLTAILLTLLALTSCTAGTDDIAAGLDIYRDVYEGETEIPYTAPAEVSHDIISDAFTIHDGKYYFTLKHRFDYGGGVRMLAYADVSTGNFGLVCPDPLCKHSGITECRYADMYGYCFTDHAGICYAFRLEYPFSVHRIDLNRDTVENVYTPEADSFSLLGYDNGKLYIRENYTLTENRQTVQHSRITVLEDNGEITEIGWIPEDQPVSPSAYPAYIRDRWFYFFADGKLIRTDPGYQNSSVIADLGHSVRQWYMDESTGELYFSSVDKKSGTGGVYVLKNGEVTHLPLPHENIYSFTLTEDRIYYTAFDPIYYGISKEVVLAQMSDPSADPEAYKTFDYSGGKLYAADRANPLSEAELVYESTVMGTDRLADLNTCVVLGDYLYFDEIDIIREVHNSVEYVYFASSYQVDKIRVNLKDGSVTRIKFE